MSPAQKTLSKEAAEIVKGFPADDYQKAQQACEKLMDGGPAVISQLVEAVGDEFGDPDGVKPKYAVHGVVMHAARPGADGQRKMVAETLAKELGGDHSDELKAFIVRQLQLCGRQEEVPALANLVSNERLCDPTTQALIAIGGDRALKALREALPKAEGKCKVAIHQAVDILTRQ